jgi:hypothetical protein
MTIIADRTLLDESPSPNNDVPFTVMVRRAALIDALRSGKFRKGTGSLLKSFYSIESGRHQKYYCCIGVGCSLVNIPDEDLIDDLESDYMTFEDQYGISHRTARYLMAMNDGDPYGETIDNDPVIGYLASNVKVIRVTQIERSFEEIARFLEIIWRMTPSGDTEN